MRPYDTITIERSREEERVTLKKNYTTITYVRRRTVISRTTTKSSNFFDVRALFYLKDDWEPQMDDVCVGFVYQYLLH